jgi:membrane protein DedA with SNARE-associated domain
MESFIESHAVYAIVILGVLEAMCIPWSSEVTFLLAGAVASGGLAAASQHPSLIEVIILGTVAEMVGSYVSYYVGRVGGKPLVRRWGRYVLITENDVARAERFLIGRGAWAVPVARMLPFIRAFASIVCGLVEIPPFRFGILNFIGTLVYAIVLSSVGYSLGNEWTKFNHTFSTISYVIVAVVVVALAYFVVKRIREFRAEASAGPGQPASGQPGAGSAPRNSSYEAPRGQQGYDQRDQYGQQQYDNSYDQPRNQPSFDPRGQQQYQNQPRGQQQNPPRNDDPRYRAGR